MKKCLSHTLEDVRYCLPKAGWKWQYFQSFAKIILTPLYSCSSTFSFSNIDFSWRSQWQSCSILFLFTLYQNSGLITTEALCPFLIYCAFHTPPQLYVSRLFIHTTMFSLSYFAKSGRKDETYIFSIVLFHKCVFFFFWITLLRHNTR